MTIQRNEGSQEADSTYRLLRVGIESALNDFLPRYREEAPEEFLREQPHIEMEVGLRSILDEIAQS